jgi:hypothetical protein
LEHDAASRGSRIPPFRRDILYLVNSAIFTIENEAPFEKSVFDDPVTHRHVPDDGNSQLHLKPRKVRTTAPSVTKFEI